MWSKQRKSDRGSGDHFPLDYPFTVERQIMKMDAYLTRGKMDSETRPIKSKDMNGFKKRKIATHLPFKIFSYNKFRWVPLSVF
jgi:hypothetical protein